MGLVQLITAILNLPSTIEALWNKIAELQASLEKYQKAQLVTAVVENQKQTEAAQSDEDFQKASAANAANLGKL